MVVETGSGSRATGSGSKRQEVVIPWTSLWLVGAVEVNQRPTLKHARRPGACNHACWARGSTFVLARPGRQLLQPLELLVLYLLWSLTASGQPFPGCTHMCEWITPPPQRPRDCKYTAALWFFEGWHGQTNQLSFPWHMWDRADTSDKHSVCIVW